MQFRRATPADYPALVEIAAASGSDSAAAAARGRGFLTGKFDLAKFAAFDADLGILVAASGAEIAGFLCATSANSAVHAPIVEAMLQACRAIRFDGCAWSALKPFTYGPVCIAPAWQGRGVLKGLFAALRQEFRGRFDTGVLFIDAANPHSLSAHEKGLGMRPVGQFEFGRRRYHILSFRLDA